MCLSVSVCLSACHTAPALQEEPKPGERVSSGAAPPPHAAMADTAAPPQVAAPAGPGINPLARKLNKILETRLDNDKVGPRAPAPPLRGAKGAAEPGRRPQDPRGLPEGRREPSALSQGAGRGLQWELGVKVGFWPLRVCPALLPVLGTLVPRSWGGTAEASPGFGVL